MQTNTRIILARIVAYLIDAILLFIVFFFIGYFFPLSQSINSLIDDVLTFSYFIYFNSKMGNGQTYGKRFFYIKVVENVTGETISLQKAFIRESLWIIIAIIDWITRALLLDFSALRYIDFSYLVSILILLTILFDKNSRGVHDKLAGTKVISTN